MSRGSVFTMLAIAVCALFGAARLQIGTDIIDLLPGNNAVSHGLQVYQERFLQSGELVVTFQAKTAEDADRATTAAAQGLAAASNLVERVFRQPPAHESLRDAARFLAYLWLNGPAGQVADLQQAVASGHLATNLAAVREQIQSSLSPSDFMILPRDPLDLTRAARSPAGALESPEQFFSSPDGTFRILYVYAATELKDYAQCAAWLTKVRALIQESLALEQVEASVGLTGRPVFVDEIASGMRNDMRTAAPGTLLMIGLLFYLAHRELRSLVFLITTLALVMIATVAVGAAILGSLNVISIGFAAILLGLAEDFGVVLHQETKSNPGWTAAEVRRVAGPPIWWSAITTASAFALLNLSSLPGLRQLGTLIAVGILLGAWAMQYLFLPLLLNRRAPIATILPLDNRIERKPDRWTPRTARFVTLAIALLSLAILVFDPPSFNASPDVLRPRRSEASATLKRVQENIGVSIEPLWLFVQGETVEEVRVNLERMNDHLSANRESLGLDSFTLPLNIWPSPDLQAKNLPVLQGMAREFPRVRETILSAGFTTEAVELSETVFAEWGAYAGTNVAWPKGRVADWVLPKFVSRSDTNFLALGLITPGPSFTRTALVPSNLRESVRISGWSLMGQEVLRLVTHEIPRICLAVAVVLVVALSVAFRTVRGVTLSLSVLLFSGVVLLATMSLLHWQWNLLNLTALPLLLGMGIDYSIHIQSALDRPIEERVDSLRDVIRALLLAGATSIIGFVFLSFSSNAGMASLGSVCALGLTILLLTSIGLLPGWTDRLKMAPQTQIGRE